MKPGILSSGTKFTGQANEKAKKLFKERETKTLGELTDYTVLDQYHVSVSGDNPPPPMKDWSLLNEKIQTALLNASFSQPTPAQQYGIPCFLSQRAFIMISPTGSGKTLAYALPLLHLLNDKPQNELNCIILMPTRELASQVFRQFIRFSEASTVRVQLLRKNRDIPKCQILIATPKRLIDMKPNLTQIEYVVVDEADQLLSHSFVQQTDQVFSMLPSNRKLHFSLFTATMMPKVEETAKSFLINPIRIQVGDDHAVAALITQELKFVGKEKGKVVEIRQRLNEGSIELPVMIFVSNKQRAYDLAGELGVPCAVLTSEKSDTERAEAIRMVRTGATQILITTDLGCRGIDIAALKTVINFDMPPNSITYIHRIGRTARAGRGGHAITFFTIDDQPYLRPVASIMKKSGYEVEDWMLNKMDRKHSGARALYEPMKRHTISSRVWKNAKVRNPKPKTQILE
ncbi:P-loop containing nucleoside triphosphate hydrolase protein [Histomonas meleagridis]|uniref:P-loop containing nucleoside triphosphate hydrolase protein n=1 Tax=Histomonas meleagridis TaxID=135588 RepID=UPI00355A119C|nr:P-loop containing nucleoside triphosphate hydrolase protein [Histomonas meleagridis]KAH0805829.1 P-loop containing nucleoside triphosphate hydrolase protein [Histomonas meleagridis]